jgi:pyruvate/2-oxoglutarate dehydrogenase complex dihydrolipoamide dehydrogenase (E3) component
MDVDVIIIGSGQAGVPLAMRLAAAGKRVLLAERAELGGTCVNSGCTPTKTMIASARAAHVARTSERLGVKTGNVKVDLSAIVDRKNAVVGRWRDGLMKRLSGAGERLKLVHGTARFTGERQVEINGEQHRAEIVVINVGARPAVPGIRGIDSVPWLDNRSIMELRELPRNLLILGGGYIGCEFGQMFRRFGSEVTVVDPMDHLLSREDPDISAEIQSVFQKEGIRLQLGSPAATLSKAGEEIVVRVESGEEIRGSHLLIAVGRRPNTDDLGCERSGIRLDEKGFIAIDDHYRTSAPGIYAVGDVTGEPQFTHVAWDDHRILFEILLGRSNRGRSGRGYPYTAFTDPQLAGVGLTEREAKKKGIAYEAATLPFGSIARAIEVDETAGILKVLLDPKTEKVLGAAIVGAEAGELIHVFVTLMQAGASARAIVDAQFVHPTFAEGVQSVVMKLNRFSLDP